MADQVRVRQYRCRFENEKLVCEILCDGPISSKIDPKERGRFIEQAGCSAPNDFSARDLFNAEELAKKIRREFGVVSDQQLNASHSRPDGRTTLPFGDFPAGCSIEWKTTIKEDFYLSSYKVQCLRHLMSNVRGCLLIVITPRRLSENSFVLVYFSGNLSCIMTDVLHAMDGKNTETDCFEIWGIEDYLNVDYTSQGPPCERRFRPVSMSHKTKQLQITYEEELDETVEYLQKRGFYVAFEKSSMYWSKQKDFEQFAKFPPDKGSLSYDLTQRYNTDIRERTDAIFTTLGHMSSEYVGGIYDFRPVFKVHRISEDLFVLQRLTTAFCPVCRQHSADFVNRQHTAGDLVVCFSVCWTGEHIMEITCCASGVENTISDLYILKSKEEVRTFAPSEVKRRTPNILSPAEKEDRSIVIREVKSDTHLWNSYVVESIVKVTTVDVTTGKTVPDHVYELTDKEILFHVKTYIRSRNMQLLFFADLAEVQSQMIRLLGVPYRRGKRHVWLGFRFQDEDEDKRPRPCSQVSNTTALAGSV